MSPQDVYLYWVGYATVMCASVALVAASLVAIFAVACFLMENLFFPASFYQAGKFWLSCLLTKGEGKGERLFQIIAYRVLEILEECPEPVKYRAALLEALGAQDKPAVKHSDGPL